MATMAAPVANQRSQQARSPWLLASTVPLAAFMELLDTTIVNVAVEHIAGDLSSSIDEATYVLTSYLVSNVVVLPLSGYLSGVLGRKNYYLWSVVIFTVASALCGFAPTLGALVFFRVIQGLGGGGLQPVSQAILMDAFPPEKRSQAQAVFSIVATTAPALGPLLGGWFTDNYTWRWVFFVNVPIGIAAFVLNLRLLEDPPELPRFSFHERLFDYQGIGLLAVCLGCMQVVLDRGQIDDWFGSGFITAFTILSVAALVLFIWWELRHVSPVVDLRILGNRNFALSTLAMFIMGFVFYAGTYMIPLFCQQMLGWTATWAGLALSPSIIVFIAMMPLMPLLITKITPRRMVIAGFIFEGLACFAMTRWDLQIPYKTVLVTRIYQVSGLAWLVVPINVMAFSYLAKDKTTGGSGLLSLARNFGASCGVSVAATLLARRAQTHQDMLVGHLTSGDSQLAERCAALARRLVEQGMSIADAPHAAMAFVHRELERQAMMLSYIDVFSLLAMISVLASPIPLILSKPKRIAAEAIAQADH
jgi:MFS transporter, DHA2 family, multidrug resistance protein